MPRPQKDRPKRYKAYNFAFDEENMTYEIPESTLRSQRKRKRDNDSTSDSTDGGEEFALNCGRVYSDQDVEGAADSSHYTRGDSDQEHQINETNSETIRHNSGDDEYQSSCSDDSLNADDTGSEDVHLPSSHEADETNSSSNSASSESDEAQSSHDHHEAETESSGNEPDFNSNNQSYETISNLDSDHASGDELLVDHDINGSHEEVAEYDDLRDEHQPSDHEADETNAEHEQLRDEDQQQEQDNDGVIDPFRKLKAKLEDQFKNPLNSIVTLSVGEILTNALTLVKKHNWNHTEKEDLLKFANALLDSNAVPDSRFLSDQYFFSKTGMTYHFFCDECTHLFLTTSATSHSQTQIACPNAKCLKVNCISDLRKATFFVTFDIPYQLKLILDDPAIHSKLVNPVDFKSAPEDGIMRDLYHGSSYREFANYVDKLSDINTKFLSFSLSVDSASLCSFSRQSICPCFIMVNELPPVIRMKYLVVGGLWFGLRKEKLDLFLPPIVQHIIDLSSAGFTLQLKDVTWKVKAFLIACIADSVARCDVQGIHAHRGDFPCSWCLCEGEEYAGSRIFPHEQILPQARTVQELLQDSRQAAREKRFVRRVKYLCLLAAAPMFHPVNGFIVDQMHAKDEGSTKSFLNAWLGEDGKTPYYLGPAKIKKINSLLNTVKIPRELRKGVRSLVHVGYFTGRELENWNFFLSLAVLPGLLPERYLKHWALYVQGTYLLLSSELHLDVVNIAQTILEEFCSKTQDLYGHHMMRFNLHLLRHFSDNTRRWGPMFALSAYAMEAGNQRLKKLVPDCNGIPNQICRGISEGQALDILRDYCDSDATRSFAMSIEPKSHVNRVQLVGKIELLGFPKVFTPSEEDIWLFTNKNVNLEDCVEFPLLKKDGCHFGPGSSRGSKLDNSCAKLKIQMIICITKIVFNEKSRDIWIVGRRMRCVPSSYCPMSVVRYDASLCFQYIVESIDEDKDIYDVADLTTVCVSLPFAHGHFLIPMPNIFNMY